MSIKVTDVELLFNKGSKVVRGVKGNQMPKNALYGGNGSYRTSERPEVRIHTSDSKTTDFYDAIRLQTTRTRVTEKYARQVCQSLVGKEFEDQRAIAQAVYDNMEKLK